MASFDAGRAGSPGGHSRGDDRRQALVAAAFRRIATDGFEGLRTRDVAADVGVNIATLHYYFPTKEALIRGVVGYAMQRFTATMPREGSPAEQLRAHLRTLAKLLKEEHELWAVMGELVLRAPRDPHLERVVRETDDFWHRRLTDLISRAIGTGEIDSALDADGTAALMIVALKGVSLPSVAGFQPHRPDQIIRELERLLGLSHLRKGLDRYSS
jgi:AcrR family transcriptional regulator